MHSWADATPMVLNLGCILGENSVSRLHPGPVEREFLRVQSEHNLKKSEYPHSEVIGLTWTLFLALWVTDNQHHLGTG